MYQYKNKDDLTQVYRYWLYRLELKLQNVIWSYGKRLALPCEVAPLLRDDLFSDGESVVLTSSNQRAVRVGPYLVKSSEINKF